MPEVKKENTRVRAKAFMYTCWNNHETAIEELKKIKYAYLLIGGYEEGEQAQETHEDKKHFHALVQFEKIVGIKKILTILNKYGHIDIANKGTAEYIKNYCIKLEKEGLKVKEKFENQQIIFEDGTFIDECYGSGARSDLKKILSECKTRGELMDKHPETYVKYNGGIDKIYKRKEKKDNLKKLTERRKNEISVEYHTGESGSGKTYYLEEKIEEIAEINEHVAEIQPVNGEFWEVVAGTEDNIEILFMNEFRDGDMKLNRFLQILEGRGTIPTKGGSLNLFSLKKIYIASIKEPWNLYKNQNEDVKSQIKRRIKAIYQHYKEDEKYKMKKIEWKDKIEMLKPDYEEDEE